MDQNTVLTLIFAGLAIFIALKLRAVLGQRNGVERDHSEQFRAPPPAVGGGAPADSAQDRVIQFPGQPKPTVPPAARLQGIVPPESSAHAALVSLMQQDTQFDPAEFIQGAKAAYEMIVMAFAHADRTTLRNLLADDVYEDFEELIKTRESQGEKQETRFVSIDKAEIVDVLLRPKTVQISIRFVSQLISATRDRTGAVIAGSAETIDEVADRWSFAREIGAQDPNWRLVSTQHEG